MKKSGASPGQPAAQLISQRIAELGDWRGKTLGRMRRLIKEADPDVVEEWKWMGTRVWSHDGILCNVRRAIDIREGEEVDASAFKALVRQALALNRSGKSKAAKKAKS